MGPDMGMLDLTDMTGRVNQTRIDKPGRGNHGGKTIINKKGSSIQINPSRVMICHSDAFLGFGGVVV